MLEIKPTQKIPITQDPKIFLAGSIEMGSAEHWQDRVVKKFAQEQIVVLNPRRNNWDAGWEQRKENPDFRGQVEWELRALELSDHIILYFDPLTKSPISLLEMGLYARGGKLLITCPEGFWKKGNVDIVCDLYRVPQFTNLDSLLKHLVSLIRQGRVS